MNSEDDTLEDRTENAADLIEAIEQAVDDWVDEEAIPIERDDDRIIADEEVLIENIAVMVAFTADSFSS